jgi:hypothetical protein
LLGVFAVYFSPVRRLRTIDEARQGSSAEA